MRCSIYCLASSDPIFVYDTQRCWPFLLSAQDIPGGPVLMESRHTEAGTEMAVCDDSPAGSLGLSTCYDLRFPEMYACLAGKGAQVCLKAVPRLPT